MKGTFLSKHGLSIALLVSLGVHLGIGMSVSYSEPPPLDFEFAMPMEVEFGTASAMEFAVEAGPADVVEPEPAQPEPEPAPAEVPIEPIVEEAEAEVEEAEAEVEPDPEEEETEETEEPEDLSDEGEEESDENENEEDSDDEGDEGENQQTSSRIPPGAQIALRLDMDQVRQSRMAGQVRRVLESIPDWHLILDGSGVDPMTDLDRLMIATPNLQRERLVMAGRHTRANSGESDYIRQVASRMAENNDAETSWREENGVEVIDWPNRDAQERVLARVGPSHFTITRPEDLVRVLALTEARAQRGADDGPSGEGADALLSMELAEAVSLEIEGIERFVTRVAEGVDRSVLPSRIRLGGWDDGSGIQVEVTAYFPDEATAERAREYWNQQLAARIDSVPAMMRGMVGNIEMVVEGSNLQLSYHASYLIASLGFGQAIGRIRSHAEARGYRTDGSRLDEEPRGTTGFGPAETAEPDEEEPGATEDATEDETEEVDELTDPSSLRLDLPSLGGPSLSPGLGGPSLRLGGSLGETGSNGGGANEGEGTEGEDGVE